VNPVVNAKKILTRLARHPAGAKRGNPEYKQDFINNDSNFPMSHYGHISEPTVPNVDIPRFIDPYELRGSVLTPLYGDQTDAGRRLKSILIGDLQFDLDRPVELMGGPRFGLYQRYNEDPNAIWASDKGAVSKYAAGWRGLSEKHGGADVLPVFTGQGRQAQQSNTMFLDVLAQMLNSSPLNRAAVKLFDEGARKIAPNFVGMRSEKLANQLRDMSFDLRGEFMKNYVASKSIQQRGFPDMVAIGNALNDPGVHPDARMAGYVISRADLGNLVNRNPLFPHPSYKNNLHGEVLGGFREQIPAHLLWRPTYEARMPKAEAKYIETNGPYIGRYMDDEAIDEISQYIEDAAAARKLGGYAEGGLSTPEERARRAEEQMGGVTPDGYASSLPPTLSMQFGDLVSPYLDAAYDLFPKENPRGKFLRDMIMGEAPEAARRMAEGEPNVLANTRSRNPLDWKINSEALDMAGALPLATATGALGKVAGAVKASAPLLGGLGVIKQKGGNWVTTNLPSLKELKDSENGNLAEYEAAIDVNRMTPASRVAREINPVSSDAHAALKAQMDALEDQGLITREEWWEGVDRFSNYPRNIYQLQPSPRDYLDKVKDLKQRFGSESSPHTSSGLWDDTFDQFLEVHAPALEQDQALNDWANKQLVRYLQNDLATPGDPVRALAEKRTEEFARQRDAAYKEADRYAEHADKLRAEGPRPGMPRGTWETAIQNAETRAQQIIEGAMLDYEKNLREGTLHFKTNSRELPGGEYFGLNEQTANSGRRAAGMPEETTGTSPVARLWDVAADTAISPQTIGGIRKRANEEGWRGLKDYSGGPPMSSEQINALDPESFYHLRFYPLVNSPEEGAAINKHIISANPWTNNLSPETPMYGLDSTADLQLGELMRQMSNLLPHRWQRGEMKASGVPDSFMLKPENLKNMSVDAAIARIADANLAHEKAMLEKAANSPVIQKIKDYPESDLSWVQLSIPRQTDSVPINAGSTLDEQLEAMSDAKKAHMAKYKPELEGALKMEGTRMSHCVGGYCEPVSRGQTQIFSLRDKRGVPHTTIEVQPPSSSDWDSFWNSIPSKRRDEIFGPDSPLQGHANYVADDQEIYNEAVKHFVLPDPPRPSVLQVKGKSNAAPAGRYQPMIQDFLRSQGPWKNIDDGYNTGLERYELDELIEDNVYQPNELTDEFEVNDFDLNEGDDVLPDFDLDDEENFAKGGVVDADRNRLNSIIGAFLSDNPGQYAEAGEPERAMNVYQPNELTDEFEVNDFDLNEGDDVLRELRQDERRRPRGRVDVGFGTNSMTAPGYSRSGFGGGGSGSLQIPAGSATLELGASGGGGRMTARGPGWQQSGGGASLGRAYGELGGLPGLAGRYGVSYENQPLSLYRGMLGLDAQAYSPDGGSPPGAWERAGMVPDEKIMLTYKRDF